MLGAIRMSDVSPGTWSFEPSDIFARSLRMPLTTFDHYLIKSSINVAYK